MARKVDEWIGKTDGKIPRRNRPLDFDHIREWSEIDKKTGCWNWLRAVSTNGYGVLRVNGKNKRAHRTSFEMFHNVKVKSKLDVCHHCDNRLCVNPDHLFEGTRSENMIDCVNKGRLKIPNLRGSQLPQAKLCESDVRIIKRSPLSQRKIATKYGVSRRTVSFIRQGKTWRHV